MKAVDKEFIKIVASIPDTLDGIQELAEKIAEAGEMFIDWVGSCPQGRGIFKKIIHAKYSAFKTDIM